MDWRDIPLYIINRNRLERGFREMVEWFLKNGTRHVIIVDNISTYPPLVEYYKRMSKDITIWPQESNLGPRGFWFKAQYHKEIDVPYMVTDADLRPGQCPKDLVAQLYNVLQCVPCKVGPALRIDNLPAHYAKRELVLRWESQFWRTPATPLKAWKSPIDTTLAMYHPHQEFSGDAIRLDKPYQFEHAPWYVDESLPNEEDDYYRAHYETEHAGGQKWKTDEGTVELYGWSVRSKESLEATFRRRGLI